MRDLKTEKMKGRFILIIFTFLIMGAHPPLISLSAKEILIVDRDRNLVGIDAGEDEHLVPGLRYYVIGTDGVIKGIIQIERVTRYGSAGRILEQYREIKVGDKLKDYLNSLIPKRTEPLKRKHLLTSEEIFSLIDSSPQIKALQLERELFRDEIKQAHLRFFPMLEFQWIRGHALQEGRRIEKGHLMDVVLDILNLYWTLPFPELAKKAYLACLIQKLDIEIEKERAELIFKILELLHSYSISLRRIALLQERVKELEKELRLLGKEGTYPYLQKRLDTKLKMTRSKLESEGKALKEIKQKIALHLNLKPDSELLIEDPDKVISELSKAINPPLGGYELLLARYEMELKRAEHVLARWNIRPTFQFKIAYPSYVSTFKLSFPIKGKAVIAVSKIETEQAKSLYREEKLRSDYIIKRLNTQLYYLRKLQQRYRDLEKEVRGLKPHYWADRLDKLEKLWQIEEKLIKLKEQIGWLKLALLKYGNPKVEPEVLIGDKLPPLKACLDKLRAKPELIYLNLESQKSLEFLKEARAQHNRAKQRFFSDEYVYKLNVKQLKLQELRNLTIKDYLKLCLSSLAYELSYKLANIYRKEWELKIQRKSARQYQIDAAKIRWKWELINQIEKKMEQDLNFLDLKYRVGDLSNDWISFDVRPSLQLLRGLEDEISNAEFDPLLRERIEKLKVKLASDQIEIAKRGYWIKGPWEFYYNPRKIPTRARRGTDWKKIPRGATLTSWIGLYIPTGIIYRTPFGEQIHDLRIAHINLEIAKIKAEQNLIEEEYLRHLIWNRVTRGGKGLEARRALYNRTYQNYLEAERRLKRFQASEEEVLAYKRIYLEREHDYISEYVNFLIDKLDLLDRGIPRTRGTTLIKPLPMLLAEIPRIRIVEREAEIVKERYKRAIKLNLSDMLKLARLCVGPWFLFTIKPDINLIRAKHYARETSLWMEKANVDSDLEYQDWLTRVQMARFEEELLRKFLREIRSYLSKLREQVELTLSPYTHYVELKILEEEIEAELGKAEDQGNYALMKLKTLLGVPPEEELEIPKIQILPPKKISHPSDLIAVVSEEYPDVKLAKSKLSLAYKEKRWDAFLRNLKFGADYLLDFVVSRSYTWSITFTVFDLLLHQIGYYYQDKIQYQNTKLNLERIAIKKKVYLTYNAIKNYLSEAEKLKECLNIHLKLIEPSWKAYLEGEIGWDGEYGFLKLLYDTYKIQGLYLRNLAEYIHNLNYYKGLEKNFLKEEKFKTAKINPPFGILFIDKLRLPNLSKLTNLMEKLRLYKGFEERLKLHQRNIRIWNEKEKRRKFNLLIYRLKKRKPQELIDLYTKAQDIEYRWFLSMERIWEEDYKDYLRLKQRLKALLSSPDQEFLQEVKRAIQNLKPSIERIYVAFGPFEKEDLYKGLTNCFLKYLRNFKFSDEEIKLFFSYLPHVSRIWGQIKGEKEVKLGDWWTKYSGSFIYLFLLPYFDPGDINEIGLVIHYSLICVINHLKLGLDREQVSKEVLEKLKARLDAEGPFLLANLRRLSGDQALQFLKWQDYVIREIDKVTFKNFSYEEMDKLRRELARLNLPFWEYLEGNKLEEQMQMDIIRWAISMGGNYDKLFYLLQELSKILYKIYPEPTLEELSYCYSAVRLRYLMKMGDEVSLGLEYRRLKRSYMIGLLLFWANKALLEGMELEEIERLMERIEEIQNLPEFTSLYGRHSLVDDRYKFYRHTLIYYAERSLRRGESLEGLKELFSWMNFIQGSKNFSSLYGEIPLSGPFIYERYSIEDLHRYIGNLTFWAKWAQENKFDMTFFEKLFFLYKEALTSKQFKEKLEQIYQGIGIEIDLSLEGKNYEMQREIIGIISNWVLYLYLRGLDRFDEILEALNQIGTIAGLSALYGLNYNQDDLRYWYQHKNEEGLSLIELKEIFKIMAQLKDLLREAVKEIRSELKGQGILRRINPHLEEISSRVMLKGEIQRLAEEIVYPQQIPIKELIEEYKIGILIQALYKSELGLELIPAEVDEIFDFFKSKGLTLKDLIKLVEIEGRIYRMLRAEGFKGVFSENKMRGYIWEIAYRYGWDFARSYFRDWGKRLITFLEVFEEEHGYLPPWRLIFSFLNSSTIKTPEWRFKLLIKEGQLSQDTRDLLIVNLGDKLNILRECLYFYYENFPLGFQPDFYMSKFKEFNPYQLLEYLEGLKELEENLSALLLENKIKDGNFVALIQDVMREAHPMLLKFYEDRDLYKSRVKGFAQRAKDGFKEIFPNKEIQKELSSPERRPLIIREIREKAKQRYGINLSPARTYSILWKLREGYKIGEALDVFIGYYRRLINLYRERVGEEIGGEMNNLLIHLSQQLFLTPLELEDVKEIFSIFKELKGLMSMKGIKIPNSRLYRDAETIYFTGLHAEDVKLISNFMGKVKGYFNRGQWRKLLYICLRSFNSQLYYIPDPKIPSWKDYPILKREIAQMRDLIPLLNDNEILPQAVYYYHLKAKLKTQHLKLRPTYSIQILARTLYLKSMDPQIVRILLGVDTDAEAYAAIRRLERKMSMMGDKLIRRELKDLCR